MQLFDFFDSVDVNLINENKYTEKAARIEAIAEIIILPLIINLTEPRYTR